MNGWASLSLWRREMVRFLRQRDRVIGALLTPVVFWWLLGAGLGRSFQTPGTTGSQGYLEYFFAGTLMMILLFTAIFSTISVIEDRREGFLQGVLVAPVGPSALVVGKVLGGATLAVGQALVFLVLAPVAGVKLGWVAVIWLAGVMSLVAVAFTGLSFFIAWWTNSSQGYHAIMNLLLLPMWLLSGAVFPLDGASPVLRWIMRLNPATYGTDLIRHGLYWQPGLDARDWRALIVTGLFAGTMIVLALMAARRPARGTE